MSATDGSEMDGYEALVSELRASPPVAPERLRQRVLEGAPATRAPRSRKRRLVLVVVPAAVVLAVGAALVHGFVSSGSHERCRPQGAALRPNARLSPQAVNRVVGSGSATDDGDRRPRRCSEGDAVAVGVQSYNLDQNTAVASGSAALAGPLSSTGRSLSIPKNRLVHAVASLQVGVKGKDLSAKTNEASQIAGSFGGYAQSVRYQHSRNGYGNAVLDLRVPVQNAEAAIAKLGGLGTLLSQQVSTQDLQAKVTQSDERDRIAAARDRRVREGAREHDALRHRAGRHPDQAQQRPPRARAVAARSQRHPGARARRPTSRCCSRRRTTRSSRPIIDGSTRIGRLLGSAAHFLALEGIIVLYALIVLAPFLLLGALGWWILRERRRREERLLASA